MLIMAITLGSSNDLPRINVSIFMSFLILIHTFYIINRNYQNIELLFHKPFDVFSLFLIRKMTIS